MTKSRDKYQVSCLLICSDNICATQLYILFEIYALKYTLKLRKLLTCDRLGYSNQDNHKPLSRPNVSRLLF